MTMDCLFLTIIILAFMFDTELREFIRSLSEGARKEDPPPWESVVCCPACGSATKAPIVITRTVPVECHKCGISISIKTEIVDDLG